MPSTFTTNTGIEKIGDGEQAGLWGSTTNANFDIIDRSLNGVASIALASTSYTLTTSSGTLSEGQYAAITFTGTPGGTATVTVFPATAQKTFALRNSTNQSVVLTQGSGGNVTLAAGTSAIVACTGSGPTSAVFDITALMNAATSANTASAVVRRDASGNFAAGTMTGNVTGNVTGNITTPSFTLGGTPVTASGAELNILDGVTATTAELNILDGVTATAAELNVLDGVTATTAELNILDGVTATAAELNILDGVTATTTELNYIDGVTAPIQSQIDTIVGGQLNITGAASTIVSDNLAVSRAVVSDASGKVAASVVTSTELGYLDGVTSSVQTQLNGKQATITGGASSISTTNLSVSRALVSDASGKVAASVVTEAELSALDGVTATGTNVIRAADQAAGRDALGVPDIFISTSAPTGGADGDLWFQY